MKYLPLIYLSLFLWGCSKEHPEKPIPDPITCTKDSIKKYEGIYEMWEYRPIIDSLNRVTWTYDTVSVTFHLKYPDCGKISVTEKNTVFSFDSTLIASVNLSTDPQWVARHQLTIINKDSILYFEEYGHLGRVFHWYAGHIQ